MILPLRIPFYSRRDPVLFLFLLLSLLLPIFVKAQGTSPQAAKAIDQIIGRTGSLLINGFMARVSGDTMSYHSANEFVQSTLIVRAQDGNWRMQWLTDSVPSVVKDSTVTFAWLAGMSVEKGVHNFNLAINGIPTIDFANPSNSENNVVTFVGGRGERMTLVATTVDQFGALFGYMFLEVPSRLVNPGVPLLLSAVGRAEHSDAWYMTFQYPLKPRLRGRGMPLLISKNDSPHQLIQIAIENYEAPKIYEVYVDPAQRTKIHAPWGLTTFKLPVPAVAGPTRARLTFESEGRLVETDTLTLNVVHRRVFYLLSHSHTDIGYSAYQKVVEQQHINYLNEAIRLAQQTRSFPKGMQFRWNVEVLWPLESYLNQASDSEKHEFEEAVKQGWIGLDALYGNLLTGLCRPEELIHATDYARFIGKRYGVPMSTAMITDIPAYTSSTITALSLAGIKYLSSGPNYEPNNPDLGDRIGFSLKTWADKPFYWESESGQHKVLFWMAGRGYSWFHGLRMGPLEQASLPAICDYLDELEAKNYPYDMVQVRYTIKGDNGPPDSDLAPFVRKWNEQYLSPKIVLSTTQEMFTAFEQKYGSQLPTYRGDFTPYWEDGAASTARELALNRNAAETLVQAATLQTMSDPAQYDSAAYYTAWRDVVLFDEHTWGAAASISEPDSHDVVAQWEYKKVFADDATRKAHDLLERAKKPMMSKKPNATFDVVNTCSWPRTDLVTIPAEQSRGEDIVKDSRGEDLPSQRLSTGELAVLVSNVPPFGAKRVSLHKGSDRHRVVDLSVGGARIDNGLITLAVDETTGAIKSLVWNNIEFVDTAKGAGLNQYFYVPGRNPSTALTDLLTHVEVKERGPLMASLKVTSSPPGTNGFQREIRLVRGLPRVDILDLIDKTKVREKESVHIGFPFLVPQGVIRMDDGWEAIRPLEDQLPGACKDYFSVQRWVDISNDMRGITWTNPDAPLVEIGEMTNEMLVRKGTRAWRTFLEPAQNIYSYVMNNYWHTNYKADQEGKVSFHYAIVPHGSYDGGAAARIGVETSQPLIVVPNPRRSVGASLLTVEPASVIVSSLKPSTDKRGFIVRLYNASDDSCRVTVRWNVGKSRMYTSSLLEEKGALVDRSVPVPRCGVLTFRIEPEK